jgi:hypothetical protein
MISVFVCFCFGKFSVSRKLLVVSHGWRAREKKTIGSHLFQSGTELLGRKSLFLQELLGPEGSCVWKRRAQSPWGHVSSWLLFIAAVRHCFDLIYIFYIFVLSNRTSFLSPERNDINSARFFANPVTREEEESYIQMVMLYFHILFLLPIYSLVNSL